MARWEYASRGNPCPICRDTDPDCRRNVDREMWFCHSFIDADAGVAGWRYVGADSSLVWGRYVIDNGREETEEGRKRRAERIAEAERARQRELWNLSKSLPVAERSSQNRQLLGQLSLTDRDRADLRRRGLSDEQIREGLFASISPEQKLDRPISPRLAGVGRDGRSLFAIGEGYLCPAWDLDDRLVGMQLRLAGADKLKYRWLKSKFSSKLPNGEWPITVVRPPHDRHLPTGHKAQAADIVLCEGILKPWIAAQFANAVFIGAASGYFGNSQKQLKAALQRLSAELGTKTVTIAPDANGLSNRHVAQRDRKTIALVRSLGYEVRIAYWGQGFDKTAPDIDELLAAGRGGEIEHLSPWAYQRLRGYVLDRGEETGQTEWEKDLAKLDRAIATTIQNSSWKVRGEENLHPRLSAKFKIQNLESKTVQTPERPQTSHLTPRTSHLTLYDRRNDGKLIWHYKPGQLPTLAEWVDRGRPTIEYQEGDRIACWEEARAKGYPTLIDTSATGQGKSHDAGIFGIRTANAMDTAGDEGRVFYLASDHRNPTTTTVESNFKELIVRHNGLVSDRHRRTALGRNHLLRPKPGQYPDVEGNCPETQNFLALAAKGYVVHGGKGSPICENCPLFGNCEFLETAARQLQQERALRAHLDRISTPKPTDVGIVEEAGASVKNTVTRTANWSAIATEAMQLSAEHPHLYDRVYKVVAAIYKALQNLETYHGLSHAEVIELLPTREELAGDIHAFYGDDREREDAWETPSLEWVRNAIDKALSPHLEEIFASGLSMEEKQAKIDSISPKWIVSVLDAISGNPRISLRITKDKQLAITRPSRRHARTLRGFGFLLMLDATADKRDLARATGIAADDMVTVRQARPDYSNLTIKVVRGIGSCGRQRHDGPFGQQTRIGAALGGIEQLHPNQTVAAIDFKSKIENLNIEHKGYWFRDSRGSNAFKDADVLALVGMPAANLGQQAADFQSARGVAVTPADLHPDGDDRGGEARMRLRSQRAYAAGVRRQLEGELIQSVGRLRSHLQPLRDKFAYLLGAWSEGTIERLQEQFPGAAIEYVEACDLAPEAASKGEQLKRAIVGTMWQFVEQWQQPTIDKVAAAVDRSKGRISQVVSEIWPPGYKALVEALWAIIRALGDDRVIAPEKLPEELRWLATEYLPMLAAEDAKTIAKELKNVVGAIGRKNFRNVLRFASVSILAGLFDRLIGRGKPAIDSS